MKKSLRFFGKVNMLLLGAIFTFSQSFAQQFQFSTSANQAQHNHDEKCAHVILEKKLEQEMGYFGSKPFFESWIDDKIEARKSKPAILARTNEDPMLIPVVVHVIHSGEAEGQGTNIPTAQILEQIRILNEDFQRLNADAANTPSEFLPVAGSTNIEFILAKQDPSGLPTNGITRTQGPKASYNPNTDVTVIAQVEHWNSEEYMNMYVVPLTTPFIGYSSFPISDLPGLNFPASSALTDGVVIDYRYFGTGGNATSASLGRTATHEVGHFFGLRHIWGDGGCEADDFVEDTPLQDNSNNSCSPTVTRFSCDSNDMIQNFMDYTPDACMNLFTAGQVERFEVVLANSPRRVTLINNRATQDPILSDNDLAISKILEPGDYTCDPLIQPSIVLLNAGNNRLTSGRVEMRRNGTLLESKRFSFNLLTGQTATVGFNSFSISGDTNEIEFRITETNDGADANPLNNSLTASPELQRPIALPYEADLSSFPEPWTIENPDGAITWEIVNQTVSGTAQQLIYINNYEYEAPGQLDYFISPIIDLGVYPNAQLVFEVAHAPYDQSGFQDELTVAISADCGNTFDLANAPYDKSGQSLQTSASTLDEFFPTQDSQFRTELVNLSDFADLGSVRVALIAGNNYGNNVFIRNIRILPNEEFNYNLQLNSLLSPSPISDGTHESENVQITNTGNLPISTFLFSKSTNDSNPLTLVASGANFEPNESFTLQSEVSTENGKNEIFVKISRPNFDQNGNNADSLNRYALVDSSVVTVPWRENFEGENGISPWLAINPESDAEGWEMISNTGTAINSSYTLPSGAAGQSYWLGTPIFDLSSSPQASIFFDAGTLGANENARLRLLASVDGGLTYSEVWSARGAELVNQNLDPTNPNSLGTGTRKYVDLSEFAGTGSTKVRLAFVADGISPTDNPLYLDNIELFLRANPNPVIPAEGRMVLFPNPATEVFNLAFNLPAYEEVNIQVISVTGAVLQDINYPNTLNQTYTFSTDLFSKGVYIVKVTSNSIRETRRLLIN
ncbi:M43 family zinc metalloprotease [Algoriphagus halophytocola]|uniref:M43 family zinc metalloprotease n=1 Tax=Algoriphagus halophytocola TaxID=2991499 RepID=A0ABY6MHF9_9BACT|nr:MULTISPECIES: M43 family zinc metalloprotease [unclassified Algoriphagus]UZD23228.1 M43 family zinc metalloprotease [Algoriphagus sp. TR-M5]WBL44521.1 M43 family zinc metalloprotease [Algoriphagus sp. TR-M9]